MDQLDARVQGCAARWNLSVGSAISSSEASAVFAATCPDGSAAVLKLQHPDSDSQHEAAALQAWDGAGAVRLIASDPGNHALLLERCDPGDPLAAVAPDEAIEVLQGLLPRLWIAASGFRSVSDRLDSWTADIQAIPIEMGLRDAALDAIEQLRLPTGPPVLVNQDLHGLNILRAQREPWLVIDPKPLAGEKEFSMASIVRSPELGHSRVLALRRLDRLTQTLGLDRERARLWTLVHTLAWGREGGDIIPDRIDVARWMRDA